MERRSDMRIDKKIIIFLLLIPLIFTMCSCRVRTTKVGIENLAESVVIEQPIEAPKEDEITNKQDDNDELTSNNQKQEEVQQEEPKENPESEHKKKKSEKKKDEVKTKEEAEDEPADLEDPDDDNKSEEGKDDEKHDDDDSGDINDDDPDDPSDRDDPSEEDKEQEEAPIHTAVEIYQELMAANNAELYECQRLQVYFELESEFASVTRDDYRHVLIEKAGGYNIAEIKYSEITADWVDRKQPQIIVKVVDSSVLGSGVYDTSAADSKLSEILYREGFEGLPAVTSATIVAISNELFDSKEGQVLAELYMAKAMYPAIYGDYNLEDVTGELLGSDSIYGYIY